MQKKKFALNVMYGLAVLAGLKSRNVVINFVQVLFNEELGEEARVPISCNIYGSVPASYE